jgi:molybdenum cofactor biosynthesis enzyme MoaA
MKTHTVLRKEVNDREMPELMATMERHKLMNNMKMTELMANTGVQPELVTNTGMQVMTVELWPDKLTVTVVIKRFWPCK